MLGRSKPRTTTAGSRMPSRSMISSRTGGAAVAVSARISGARAPRPRPRGAGSRGGSRGPTRRCSAPRRPRRARRGGRQLAQPSGLASCSGASKHELERASASSASAARARPAHVRVELRRAAGRAALKDRSTWSRWSAISGETTTVAPGISSAGDLVDRRFARARGHTTTCRARPAPPHRLALAGRSASKPNASRATRSIRSVVPATVASGLPGARPSAETRPGAHGRGAAARRSRQRERWIRTTRAGS